MKAAYADGCDCANYGVVGGLDLNSHLVLTQSLVHRTHQTMFGSHLAPTTINNWHLDDRLDVDLVWAPRDQPLEARAHAQHKQVWDAVF
jgi:hypothetical protein